MSLEFIEKTIHEREWKNEKILSWFRFSASSLFTLFDFLAYFNIVQFTAVPANRITILLDFGLLIFALTALFILKRNTYLPNFKFAMIFADYCIIFLMFNFDTTVPLQGSSGLYTIFLSAIYIYLLNLLRYSQKGTIFAIFTAIIFFEGNRFLFISEDTEGLIPMLRVALSIILFLGYAITKANYEMIQEIGTKKIMERYLSSELVGNLDKGKIEEIGLGKIQNLTVLFSDIRGFTTLTEKLQPNETVQFLNQYLSIMTDQILTEKGMIDKFIGDAIFATFGLQDSPNRSLNAIQAAIKIQKSLSKLSHPIEIGIGIHNGDVILGNIGSEKRFDYTAIGDTVNLTSRIESLTKLYKCKILVSEFIIADLAENNFNLNFVYREIDRVRVKGKLEPITIFEICYE
ncbi:adenylate/guanylate cyclase domain-containing protein [Leptospira sp. GIMC2001]|uniref:adenylate/guanylate cyclase domain-containing protein n=1 Tax=Leptospira sp. GIMC2001 TaxID=1513297 RepID=UPI002348F5CF|nr:adenylate/guanylate cyclase domain-containing protein [Leptospira sp. GIMC2001]WCL49147.1 adenylate/guanylate cyclase domain-containing protein [Leptospira sp. GIMC2001]